jgi:hypothetical protein
MKKVMIIGTVLLFILINISSGVSSKDISINEESIEENVEPRGWNLGFILLRVTYMEFSIWYKVGFYGQTVKCEDKETGEIIRTGKTGFFGFYLFKFLPMGHDYKITAITDKYGTMSRTVKNLGFFQRVDILFII